MVEAGEWNSQAFAIHTEPLDDVPLLLAIIRELGIAEQIDRVVVPNRHWQGATVGTVVSIWLCSC